MEAHDFRCDLEPLNEGEIHFISSDIAQSYFEAFATRLVRHALAEGMANRKDIRASEYMRLKELLLQQYVVQEIYKIADRTVIVSYIFRWFIKQKHDFEQCIIELCEEQDWEDKNFDFTTLGEWKVCNTQTNTDLADYYKEQHPFPRSWATAPTVRDCEFYKSEVELQP